LTLPQGRALCALDRGFGALVGCGNARGVQVDRRLMREMEGWGKSWGCEAAISESGEIGGSVALRVG